MIEWFYFSMFVFIFRLFLFLCFHHLPPAMHFRWSYNQNDLYSNWLINCLEQFCLLAIIFCGLTLVILQRNFLYFCEMVESSWGYSDLLINLVWILLLSLCRGLLAIIYLVTEKLIFLILQPMLFLRRHVRELLLVNFIVTSLWAYI